MRYILDDNNYIKAISFGSKMECYGKECVEYTGSVPSGYSTLGEWALNAVIQAYYISEGELVYDAAKEAEIEAAAANEAAYNKPATEGFVNERSLKLIEEETVILSSLETGIYKLVNSATICTNDGVNSRTFHEGTYIIAYNSSGIVNGKIFGERWEYKFLAYDYYPDGSYDYLQIVYDYSNRKGYIDGDRIVTASKLTWTYKYQKLFDTTEFAASTPQSYSIADYLPQDDGKYEMLISGWAAPTRTTGKYITIEVKSDLMPDYMYLCSSRATQTSSAQDTAGSSIIFASSGSSLTFRAGNTSNGEGRMWITLHGYRRID